MAAKATQCLQHPWQADGTDVNVTDREGSTSFMLAARDGHVDCLKGLWDTGLVGDVSRKNRRGLTALMLATSSGHLECIEFLLNAGVPDDVNRRNRQGLTALMLAAENGHLQCLRFLLKASVADASARSYKGFSAIILAAGNGHLECVELLLETAKAKDSPAAVGKDDAWKALMCAVKGNHVRCAKFLLDTGMIDDINKDNHSGVTALMLSAMEGHLECVKLLLETGRIGDVNHRHACSLSALMYAARGGHSECVHVLLKAGNLDSMYKLGSHDGRIVSGFRSAAQFGQVECLRCVLDIAVTNEISSSDPGSDPSSGSLFEVKGSAANWYFTFAPGITWTPPYVYGRGHRGQSVLKLVVGRGLARCLVCLLLGELDVPLTGHAACRHEGLEHAERRVFHDGVAYKERSLLGTRNHPTALKEVVNSAFINSDSNSNEQLLLECLNYVLQYERIRLHTLVVSLRDGFIQYNQISLVLYRHLCDLLWDCVQIDHFLGMLCDGTHPVGRCVDFLLSALICQKEPDRESILTLAYFEYYHHDLSREQFEFLLKHVVVSPKNITQDSMYLLFDKIAPSPSVPSWEQLREFGEDLDLFLRNGVFHWSWYPKFSDTAARHVALALVIHGYSPEEFDWNGVPSTPLRHAFLTGDAGLVRYLMANLYLTSHDMDLLGNGAKDGNFYTMLGASDSIRELHRIIFGNPWKLRVLSLVKSSNLLRCHDRTYNPGPLDSLPVPRAVIQQLAFKDPVRMVDVSEWESIDIESWLC